MKLGSYKKNQKKEENKVQKQKKKAPNVVIWALLLFFLSLSLQHNMCLPTSITTKLLLPLPTKLGTRLVVYIGINSKREGNTSHLSLWSLSCSGEFLFLLSLSSW
jgi:hypothetical protein